MSSSGDLEGARLRKRRRRAHRREWKRLASGQLRLRLFVIAVALALSVVTGLALASQCASDNVANQARPSARTSSHSAPSFEVFSAAVPAIHGQTPQ